MLVLYDGDEALTATPASAVTIGVFDGLHRGHQGVIARLGELARERGLLAAVVTFDPAPATVLAPERAPKFLATIEQRLEGFEKLGVDVVRVLSFDESLAKETARAFVERVLVRELRARVIVVGEDFHFGHQREGSVALLGKCATQYNFALEPSALFGDHQRWSSTSVREALARGDLERAREILGYSFRLRAPVRHGDQRGRELGFPTANLAVSAHQQLPREGVYAGAATLDGHEHPAAISVGTRPQYYHDGELLVELYVLDYDGDLYDRELEVTFVTRLRDQMTFASSLALSEQIALDVSETRTIFTTLRANGPTLLG